MCGKLKFEDVEYIDEISLTKIPMTKCKLRKKCPGEGLYCKGGCNCVETPIVITPNGYVFAQDMEALKAIAENDYKNSIGHISEKTIYEMVQEHKDDKKGEVYVFRNRNVFEWHYRHVIYKCIKLREQMLNSSTNNEQSHAFAKYQMELASIKEYAATIKLNKKCTVSNTNLLLLSQLLEQIEKDYKLIKHIVELNNRFNVYGSNQAKIVELENKARDSFFAPDKFKSIFAIEYDLFVSMWESYYAMDIDKFREVMDSIDEDIKSNAKFKFN